MSLKRLVRTKNERFSDDVDLELDRLARRAYERRDMDERWRQVSMRIDAARNMVRQMMHPDDRIASLSAPLTASEPTTSLRGDDKCTS